MAHVPRVLVPAPLQAGQPIPLEAERAHHLYTVLRRRAGDAVCLWDGQGLEAPGRLTALDARGGSVQAETPRRIDRESPLQLMLVQALARGDRFEQAAVAAVELGAHSIQPVLAEHGHVKLKGERVARKQQSWQRLLLGAAEQAERSRLPALGALCSLQDWLATPRQGLLLHPEGAPLRAACAGLDWQAPLAVVVGPEGGLSPDELRRAEAAGLRRCRLGPRILRTEHAGPAALAALAALQGDY